VLDTRQTQNNKESPFPKEFAVFGMSMVIIKTTIFFSKKRFILLIIPCN